MGQRQIAAPSEDIEPRSATARTVRAALRNVRPQFPFSEHDPAAANQLSQLRAAEQPERKDRGSLRRTAPDPDLRNQLDHQQADRRQRYAVYLRKNGQYVLALHDRRIPGHLVAAVAEFRPATRKRRGAAGRISRPAGRRRQTVDLPVAGRRLADSGTESPRSVRADRRADSGHELSQFGNDRRLQQQPDRTVRPVGQRIAEPAARRVRRPPCAAN